MIQSFSSYFDQNTFPIIYSKMKRQYFILLTFFVWSAAALIDPDTNGTVVIKNVEYCSMSQIPLAETYTIDYALTVKGLASFLERYQSTSAEFTSSKEEHLNLAHGLKFHKEHLPGNWSIKMKIVRGEILVWLNYHPSNCTHMTMKGDMWMTAPFLHEAHEFRAGIFSNSEEPHHNWMHTMMDNYKSPNHMMHHQQANPEIAMGQEHNEGPYKMNHYGPMEGAAGAFGPHFMNHKMMMGAYHPMHIMWQDIFIVDSIVHKFQDYSSNHTESTATEDELTLVFHVDIVKENKPKMTGEMSHTCSQPNAESRRKIEASESARLDLEQQRMMETNNATSA